MASVKSLALFFTPRALYMDAAVSISQMQVRTGQQRFDPEAGCSSLICVQ